MKYSEYPYYKSFLLVIMILSSVRIFTMPSVMSFIHGLGQIGYLMAFTAGLLFPFGFALPFSAGFFIALDPQSILLATLLGGAGALISNLFVYHHFQGMFMTEFDSQKRIIILRKVHHLFDQSRLNRLKTYLLCIFAGFVITFPISEETETLLLTGMRELSISDITFWSLLLNTLIIFILLSI